MTNCNVCGRTINVFDVVAYCSRGCFEISRLQARVAALEKVIERLTKREGKA